MDKGFITEQVEDISAERHYPDYAYSLDTLDNPKLMRLLDTKYCNGYIFSCPQNTSFFIQKLSDSEEVIQRLGIPYIVNHYTGSQRGILPTQGGTGLYADSPDRLDTNMFEAVIDYGYDINYLSRMSAKDLAKAIGGCMEISGLSISQILVLVDVEKENILQGLEDGVALEEILTKLTIN